MEPKTYIRYGEAFKRQVVHEIETGKFEGATAAAKAYSIKGAATIARWIKAYGRPETMPRRITITTAEEQDEAKQLRKRVAQLEKALADAHMAGLLGECYLDIACRELGEPVEDFKKKSATRLSGRPGKGAAK